MKKHNMKKIIIIDNYAFTLGYCKEEECDRVYYQPINDHNEINVALDDEYAWKEEDGGSWKQCDPRMGYDLVTIQLNL